MLVNNAGFDEVGKFAAMAPARVRAMVELDGATLAALTRAFLPPMLERGAGRILNVASIAAFQAVPFLPPYAATKAFVLSLSEGLAEELKGPGVTVTAVCPGITQTQRVRRVRGASALAARVPDVLVYDEARVAHEALRACMAGEVVCVPGAVNRLMASADRYPRSLARALGRLVLRRLGRR